jgi:hypothetical protein
VAPAAAAAGIQLQEVTAAIASITKQGVPTSVATTQLRQAIVELQKPGEMLTTILQQMGYESGGAALQALGLQGTLAGLQETAAANGLTMTQVFSSVEAGAAALALTGQNAQVAAGDLAAMGNAAGTMNAAFETMDKGREFEKLKASAQASAISIGEKLLPATLKAAEGAQKLVEGFSSLPSSTQQLVLGMAALAAVMPLVINKFIAMKAAMEAMDKAALMSKVAIGSVVAGLSLLVVGVDMLLQKRTGYGILEWVFGDPRRTEAIAKTLRDIDAALRNAASGTTVLDVAQRKLIEVNTDYLINLERVRKDVDAGLYKSGITIANVLNEATAGSKEMRAAVTALGQTYRENNADIGTLTYAHNLLTGQMQKEFEVASGYHESMARFSKDVIEDAGNLEAMMYDMNIQFLETEDATGKAYDGVQKFTDSLEDAEGKAIDASKAIENLQRLFSEFNPTVEMSRATVAQLTYQMDQLIAKGPAMTENDRLLVEQYKKRIAEEEKIIKLADDQQKAMQGVGKSLTYLMGEDGYGGLLTAMKDTNLTADQQIGINGKLLEAQRLLAQGSISDVITLFGQLKKTLDPAAWDVIAQTVGPKLLNTILTSINDPKLKAEMLKAFDSLGFNGASGIAQGIKKGEPLVSGALIDLIMAGDTSAQAAIEARSPSRLFARNVGAPIAQGIAKGIEDETPVVLSAMSGLFGQLLADATARIQLEESLGGSGTRIFDALIQAITDGSEKSLGILAGYMADLQSTASDKLDPATFAAVGTSLMDALNTALTSGGAAGIDAVKAALAAINEEIALAGEGAKGTFADFLDAVNKTLEDAALEEKVGSAGARLMDALKQAIEEGTPRSLGALGGLAADMLGTLEDTLGPAKAKATGEAFMDAIRQAIETGGAEGIDALTKILADLQDKIDTASGKSSAKPDALPGGASYSNSIALWNQQSATLDAQIRDAESRLRGLQMSNTATPKQVMEAEANVTWYKQQRVTLDARKPVESLARGTDFVPRDGFAFLHKGEAVVPASQNRAGITVIVNASGYIRDTDELIKDIDRSLKRTGLGGLTR